MPVSIGTLLVFLVHKCCGDSMSGLSAATTPTYLPDFAQWQSFPALSALALPGPLLRGCERVYVDMGTNIGVKLRHLYEPERFQSRAVRTYFAGLGFDNETEVKPNRSYVCALSFEPVPSNVAKLRQLVWQLKKSGRAGRHLHQFPAAIGAASGATTFYIDNAPGGRANNWGSSLLSWQTGMGSNASRVVHVPVVGLPWLLTAHVPKRARVVAKMDIEGAEYEVLPAAHAAICAGIDVLYIETHDRFFSKRWKGHRDNFSDDGAVARLRRQLSAMTAEHKSGQCRTQWIELGRFER